MVKTSSWICKIFSIKNRELFNLDRGIWYLVIGLMYGWEKRSKKRTPSACISSAFCQGGMGRQSSFPIGFNVLSFIFCCSRNLQLDCWQLQGLPVAPSGSPEFLFQLYTMGQKESWLCINGCIMNHCEGEIIINCDFKSHFIVSESQLTPSKSSSLKSLTKVAESSAALTVRYLSDVPKINKVLACVDLRWICENRIQKCWV